MDHTLQALKYALIAKTLYTHAELILGLTSLTLHWVVSPVVKGVITYISQLSIFGHPALQLGGSLHSCSNYHLAPAAFSRLTTPHKIHSHPKFH
jgi:hypothetical protein